MDTLQAAIANFLIGQNTAQTSSTYGTPLKHFVSFLETQGIQPEQDSADKLTVGHAIAFVPWLRKRGPAKATLQLYLTVVYRFYRHLLLQGAELSASDLARLEEVYKDARNIRGESRPKDHTMEAAQATIAAARAVPKGTGREELARLRDVAIVETLRATGCRVGELVGMVLGDLNLNAKSALVKGKGSKYRNVYWDEGAWKALCTYLWERQESEKSAPVFRGHSNRSAGPLTTRSISRIVRTLGESAGVEDVTPHYFRHVFATRALERTGLALVQDMLGHASPVTTRVYARTDEGQRQAAHQAVWE